MLTGEERAVAHLPELKRHLGDLARLSGKAFSPQPSFDPSNHFSFMALTFAVKQNEHARSVLKLDESIDAVLVSRSMLEGMSQILWAGQAPEDRALRWRAFPYVLDWRRMRKRIAAGLAVPVERQRAIEEGLAEHGRLFLTPKALDAQAKGDQLPDDPYTRNWYGEKEREIFSAVGGDQLYDEIYGFFSEWHHWRPGVFGHLLELDEERTTFAMSTRNPSFTATALAAAFQCLWQTMSLLENSVLHRIRPELDSAFARYIEIGKRP